MILSSAQRRSHAGIDVITAAIACQNFLPQMPCTAGANGHIAARSKHPGGVNVSLADGSVRFVPNSIPVAVWQTLRSWARTTCALPVGRICNPSGKDGTDFHLGIAQSG